MVKKRRNDNKRIGLGHGAVTGSSRRVSMGQTSNFTQKVEAIVMKNQVNMVHNFWRALYSSLKIYVYYLISFETALVGLITVGLTLYWYFEKKNGNGMEGRWSGNSLDWIILGFAVITPMTTVISLAFRRREQALHEIARIQAASSQLYLMHQVWDWSNGNGRATSETDFLEHTDDVLTQLIGIGDELRRFLQLPTYTLPHHRVTKKGRRDAAEITEVGFHLLNSVCSYRLPRLSELGEDLKKIGLSPSELSRARQYELFITEAIEKLRHIKTYRTPQALRAFARIFVVIIPPFYAPKFAQVAIDIHSLGIGLVFAIFAPLCLTALLESLQDLEDPFVGWISLNGIDLDEEFEQLYNHKLMNMRIRYFPHAGPFVYDSSFTRADSERINSPQYDTSFDEESGIAVDVSNHRISQMAFFKNMALVDTSLRSMQKSKKTKKTLKHGDTLETVKEDVADSSA